VCWGGGDAPHGGVHADSLGSRQVRGLTRDAPHPLTVSRAFTALRACLWRHTHTETRTRARARVHTHTHTHTVAAYTHSPRRASPPRRRHRAVAAPPPACLSWPPTTALSPPARTPHYREENEGGIEDGRRTPAKGGREGIRGLVAHQARIRRAGMRNISELISLKLVRFLISSLPFHRSYTSQTLRTQ
jgi:hypothetical protein